MSKSIQFKNNENEKMYPHPYYPVGSIYLSVNDTNPSRWFGGTWVQIAKGRTLVGVDTNDTDFNTVQKTGGAKTHQLTNNQLPKLTGSFQSRPAGGLNVLDVYSGGGIFTYTRQGGSQWTNQISSLSAAGSNNKNDLITLSIGNNEAHNNLQPYFTCYIWCRTA